MKLNIVDTATGEFSGSIFLQEFIEGCVTTNAVLGDDFEDRQFFWTEVVKDYFNDYLGNVMGGVHILHDVQGTSKTVTSAIVTRSFLQQSPARFMCFTPALTTTTTGNDYYSGILEQLRLPPETDADELAMALVDALSNEEIKTDDKFRLKVVGTPPKLDYRTKGLPILLLDNFNPTCLEGSMRVKTGFWEYYEEGQSSDEDDMDFLLTASFGKECWRFLSKLVNYTGDKKQVRVIICTKYPRVAKFLQRSFDGGNKCEIAPSLWLPSYRYSAETFVFETHYQGFCWTEQALRNFLSQYYPNLKEQIIDKELEEYDEDSNSKNHRTVGHFIKILGQENLKTLPASDSKEVTSPKSKLGTKGEKKKKSAAPLTNRVVPLTNNTGATKTENALIRL